MVQDRIALIENPIEGEPRIDEGGPEEVLLKQIQAVLYSTEDGFEVPEGQEVSLPCSEHRKESTSLTDNSPPLHSHLQPALDEEEVF